MEISRQHCALAASPQKSPQVCMNLPYTTSINHYAMILILNILCITFIFILPSINQHLMHHLSYTKPHCLTNTPTHFSAHCVHLQGMPSQLLTFQHVKWFYTTALPCVVGMQSSLMTHNF